MSQHFSQHALRLLHLIVAELPVVLIDAFIICPVVVLVMLVCHTKIVGHRTLVKHKQALLICIMQLQTLVICILHDIRIHSLAAVVAVAHAARVVVVRLAAACSLLI